MAGTPWGRQDKDRPGVADDFPERTVTLQTDQGPPKKRFSPHLGQRRTKVGSGQHDMGPGPAAGAGPRVGRVQTTQGPSPRPGPPRMGAFLSGHGWGIAACRKQGEGLPVHVWAGRPRSPPTGFPEPSSKSQESCWGMDRPQGLDPQNHSSRLLSGPEVTGPPGVSESPPRGAQTQTPSHTGAREVEGGREEAQPETVLA